MTDSQVVQDDLSISTIDFLCDKVLRNYTINRELLDNWRAELVDVARNQNELSDIVSEEVLLAPPHRNSAPFIDKEDLSGFLDMLDSPQSTEYPTLRIVLFEILVCAVTVSFTVKIELFRSGIHELFAASLFKLDLANDKVHPEEVHCFISQHVRVLVAYAELGGDVTYLKQLMAPLVGNIDSPNHSSSTLHITLLKKILSNSNSNIPTLVFNDYEKQPITIPFASTSEILHCFTIQFWFKLDSFCKNEKSDDTRSIVLFQLAPSSAEDAGHTVMIKLLVDSEISSYQLVVDLFNNGNLSVILFPFNQKFTNNGADNDFNHIAITYDSSQRLSLFVDGDCSEYIPCPILQSAAGGWKKLYIGSTQNQYCHPIGQSELVLRNLAVLNIALNHQWIAFLHAIGFNYDWSYKDLSLNNVLSLMNEIQGQRYVEFASKVTDLRAKEHYRDNSGKQRSHKEVQDGSIDSRVRHTRHLMQQTFRNENVLLDFNGSRLSELEAPKYSKIVVHKTKSLTSSFYSVGGTYFLLRLIEKESRKPEADLAAEESAFFAAIELLFSIINRSWRIAREFENISGYGILSILLSNGINNRREKVKEKLILCVLKHCGYSSTGSPLLTNPQTYRHLILNADHIFAGSGSSLQIFLKHLNAMISGGEYCRWNLVELQKLKLLRKLVHILKASINSDGCAELSSDTMDELTRVVKNIVIVDSSIESIRALSLFVVYLLIPPEPTTPRNMALEDEESYIDISRTALHQIGLEILTLMTSVLCDRTRLPKKVKRFSRAITLHWILLLLGCNNTSQTNEGVVKCALNLFAKLLRALGPNVRRRFFQGSHGKEVLTYYLKDWWSNDDIVRLLFKLSFSEEALLHSNGFLTEPDSENESLNLIIETIACKDQHDGALALPQLLLVLNNVMLNSMNVLSKASGKLLSAPNSPRRSAINTYDNVEVSLNVLHLLNQMPEAIRNGFRRIRALAQVFTSAEYLEGAFELLAHLRLSLTWINKDIRSNFESCYRAWVEVLTEIFFSKINDSKHFLATLRSLNDITRQIALDTIFTSIIGHIEQFVNGIDKNSFDASVIDFVEGSLTVLCYYFNNFVEKNYYISGETTDLFTKCLVSVIELVDSAPHHQLHKLPLLSKLKSYLGQIIVMRILEIAERSVGNERPDEDEFLVNRGLSTTLEEELNSVLKFLLYRQTTVFQKEVLNDVQLSKIITLVWGIYFKFPKSEQSAVMEYTISFMRTSYMLTMDRFDQIVREAAVESQQDRQVIVTEFYRALLSQNDSESMKSINLPKVKRFFMSKFSLIVSPEAQLSGAAGRLKVMDMMSVMLHNGSSLGLNDSGYLDMFVRDCDRLKSLIIHTETLKYNRAIQDKEENSQFFITSYNSYKTEFTRLLGDSGRHVSKYSLDYIENNDSMRKRTILEEHLSESERLTYNLSVPTKEIPLKDQALTYEQAVSGLSSMALSSEMDDTNDVDDYEIINDEDTEENTDFDDRNRRVLRSLYMGDQIVALWNVSQINGLAPIESLMILGNTHVYLIENYLHCADGTVVNASNAPPELRDPYLQLINSQSSSGKMDHKLHRNKNWSLEKLSCVSKRQFLLRDVAMEMFFSDGASVLVTCLSKKDRDSIYSKLLSLATGVGLDSDLTKALNSSILHHSSSNSNTGSFFASKFTLAFANMNVLEATKKWKMGEISNFYYLMIINTIAGRTYNDLTQYPVFPWVIADYTSDTLDLLNPASFRDLSKPMGAQTQPRANQFKERYEALESLNDNQAPPFHYGTHYSSAMVVTSYLIRLRPHVQSYLLLQGGKFDHADRLFYSIEKAWNLAARDNTTDVKELTPEFFYLPEFLVNSNDFALGNLQNGTSVNDVLLPPWAHGDPKIFISKNREALESSYVSANLHLWIDLIFGVKQSGPEAVKALNVFHHLSYNGAINIDNIDDETEKRAVIGAINNFGQTPMKLFNRPHLAKEVLNVPSLYMVISCVNGPPKLLFESKLSLPIKKLEWSTKGNKWVGRPACISAEDDLLIRKVNHFKDESGSLIINSTVFLGLHDFNITALTQMGYKQFLTGSEDGVINVWKYHSAKSLHFQCVLRGHDTEITAIRYNRSYRFGVSVDASGLAICWDLVRHKFIWKVKAERVELIAVSEDTGNIAAISSTNNKQVLHVYTINGEEVVSHQLPQKVTALAFASSNGTVVPSDRRSVVNNHSYWNNEILALALTTGLSTSIQVLELVPKTSNWCLQELNHVDISATDIHTVSCIELLKKTEVDPDDRLCRGILQFVIGDVSGRVYVW